MPPPPRETQTDIRQTERERERENERESRERTAMEPDPRPRNLLPIELECPGTLLKRLDGGFFPQQIFVPGTSRYLSAKTSQWVSPLPNRLANQANPKEIVQAR